MKGLPSSPLIRRVVLWNFKGVKAGELRLAPLTLLVGPNNSGKTTVLEALLLAPGPHRPTPYGKSALTLLCTLHKTLDSEGHAFILHNYTESPAGIVVELDGESLIIRFELLEGRGRIGVSATRVRGSVTLSEIPKILERPLKRSLGSIDMYSIEREGAGSPEALMGEVLLVRPDLVRAAYGFLERRWIEFVNRGVGRRVASELSKIIVKGLVDLTLEPFGGGTHALYAYMADGRRIRLGDLGDGAQVLAVAMSLFELVKPRILVWDDVEAHMNPSLLAYTAEWIASLVEEGVQVVASTHSIEAVRLFTGMVGDRAKILLLDLEAGLLRAKELDSDDVEELWKAGLDVRSSGWLLL